MRSKRLRIVGTFTLLLALPAVWMVWNLPPDTVRSMVLIIGSGFMAAGFDLVARSEGASEKSRLGLAISIGLGTVLLSFATLLQFSNLSSLLTTTQGAFTVLNGLLSLIAFALTGSSISFFLFSGEAETFPHSAKIQASVYAMLICAGVLTLCFLDPDVIGFKVSLGLNGAYFYGFTGWKVWNALLVILAILAAIPTSWKKSWNIGLSGLFLSQIFLTYQLVGDFGILFLIPLILNPVLFALFIYFLENEVQVASSYRP